MAVRFPSLVNPIRTPLDLSCWLSGVVIVTVSNWTGRFVQNSVYDFHNTTVSNSMPAGKNSQPFFDTAAIFLKVSF